MATIKNMNENGNGTAKQCHVSNFSNDPERFWEGEQYAAQVAQTALNQICGSLVEDFGGKWQDVMASWGCMGTGGVVGKPLRWRDMPALALHVQGYAHKGWAIVSLNEGLDTYEVELADEQFFAEPDSRHEDVYCDGLGSLIDRLVETGGLSKEEYHKKIEKDCPIECWAMEHGVQVVYL